jgi:uncharacterized OB-fold protein
VAVPYTVAVLDLAEGPRMLTALLEVEPADVRVGLRVEVALRRVGEYTLPFFRPENAVPAPVTASVSLPEDHDEREIS